MPLLTGFLWVPEERAAAQPAGRHGQISSAPHPAPPADLPACSQLKDGSPPHPVWLTPNRTDTDTALQPRPGLPDGAL